MTSMTPSMASTPKISFYCAFLRKLLIVTIAAVLASSSSSSYVIGFSPAVVQLHRAGIHTTSWLSSSSSTTAADALTPRVAGAAAAPNLKSILKKQSKVLTVGVELCPKDASPSDLSILSMQLRKSKVSSIWVPSSSSSMTSDDVMKVLQTIVEEQKTSQGNFPGPVPVIYDGSTVSDDGPEETSMIRLSDLNRIGVSAVVASAAQADKIMVQNEQQKQGEDNGTPMEIIWKVSSVADVETVLQRTNHRADAFLLDAASGTAATATTTATTTIESLKDVAEAFPSASLRILAVDSMQPDGAEIEQAKKAKVDLGCNSIVVRDACLGDTEDLEYTQFVVSGMTSKASSEFKFSGLTGSTNGHFGGIQQNRKIKWRRKE